MRLITGAVVFVVVLALFAYSAFARVTRPITLSFDPAEDEFSRYMTVITLGGAITRPGDLTQLGGTFRIRAVYRDQVTAALHGLNRHSITFYDYDVFSSPIRRTREDRGLQQQAGRDNQRQSDSLSLSPPADGANSNLPQPPPIGGNVLQEDGGGGGRGGGGGNQRTGDTDATFSVDNILVSSLSYVETKSGDVLDVQGLQRLREYSRRSISPGEIRIDAGHLFEWNHVLRLPDYPVWREDMWFATIPLSVPGLPEPVMTKFMYRVLGFTRVGMRSVAIIDTHGIVEFHQYWEEENEVEVVKYEALGNFSVAARYFFDYEKGMIFGVGRPPVWDFETDGYFIGQFSRLGDFEQKYPGLLANLDMRYYTEVTKKPRTRREERIPPKPEPVDRRHVGITFFMQTEAE